MKILEDLVSTLDMKASVRDIRQGLFHTAVLTYNCGLAAMLPRDALRQERPSVNEVSFLLGENGATIALCMEERLQAQTISGNREDLQFLSG